MATTVEVFSERLTQAYRGRTRRSRELFEEAKQHLPGGSTRDTTYRWPHPLYVDRGEGCRIWDVDGNAYLDLWNNATCLVLGHAHPAVVRALMAQAPRGLSFSAATEAEIRLARLLRQRVPSLEAVRFTNSGSEAVLMALRLARAFSGRSKIVKFEGSYHGMYDHAAVSVGPPLEAAGPADRPHAVPETPGLPPQTTAEMIVLPYNDPATARRVLADRASEVAAVLVEPIANRMGVIVPRREFLAGLRDLTRDLGIVLIFDEIISFRVGPGGAQGLFGIRPDLTTLGKVIGGGLPVGAFGGRADLMALFEQGRAGRMPHHGTFNANPMTMEAGLATLTVLTPEVFDRLNALGDETRARLAEVGGRAGVPLQVTGVGSLFKLSWNPTPIVDYRTSVGGDAARERALALALLLRGYFLSPRAAGSLSVPMTKADVDGFVAAVAESLDEMRRD